jgi:hypothetical protein
MGLEGKYLGCRLELHAEREYQMYWQAILVIEEFRDGSDAPESQIRLELTPLVETQDPGELVEMAEMKLRRLGMIMLGLSPALTWDDSEGGTVPFMSIGGFVQEDLEQKTSGYIAGEHAAHGIALFLRWAASGGTA